MVSDLTRWVVDGNVVAFCVGAVRRGEDADEAPRVLRVPGIHQPQRAVSKFHLEPVQLHVVAPGRRGAAVPGSGVVREDVGVVLATGKPPL